MGYQAAGLGPVHVLFYLPEVGGGHRRSVEGVVGDELLEEVLIPFRVDLFGQPGLCVLGAIEADRLGHELAQGDLGKGAAEDVEDFSAEGLSLLL